MPKAKESTQQKPRNNKLENMNNQQIIYALEHKIFTQIMMKMVGYHKIKI